MGCAFGFTKFGFFGVYFNDTLERPDVFPDKEIQFEVTLWLHLTLVSNHALVPANINRKSRLVLSCTRSRFSKCTAQLSTSRAWLIRNQKRTQESIVSEAVLQAVVISATRGRYYRWTPINRTLIIRSSR